MTSCVNSTAHVKGGAWRWTFSSRRAPAPIGTIGIFTKISLKNKVDDLMKQFREYYQGKTTLSMKQLRQSYDLLLMKVLSLLQDTDRKLASAIVASREAIWGLLSDQKKFDALEN